MLLQRKDETSLGANVAKAERKHEIVYGQILSTVKMENQQRSCEQQNVQRLSLMGVGATGHRSEAVGTRKGEDIVCSNVKYVSVALPAVPNKKFYF